MTTFADVRKRSIRMMRLSCQTYANLLRTVSHHTATTLRDGPTGWTTLEVVCHVRDFDAFFMNRCQCMLDGLYPLLPAYDHEQLAIDRSYNTQDLLTVLAELSVHRESFAHFFEGLTEAQWECAGVHPEYGHWTMTTALMQVPTHDLVHLEQITRILSQQ
jgi:hypothetical protein